MSVQTLKSASVVRVSPSRASTLYAASRHLGEPKICPAGAGHLSYDIYGRPATQNTLTVHMDASCGQQSQYDVANHLNRENLERPYVQIAPPGLRGAGDFSGKGMDFLPVGLYENTTAGKNVRHYQTPNDAPPEHYAQPRVPYGSVIYTRGESNFDFSHDATNRKIQ